jgi:hypothetical protein
MRFALFGAVPAGLTDRGIEVFVRSIAPPEAVRLLDELEAIMREVGR